MESEDILVIFYSLEMYNRVIEVRKIIGEFLEDGDELIKWKINGKLKKNYL